MAERQPGLNPPAKAFSVFGPCAIFHEQAYICPSIYPACSLSSVLEGMPLKWQRSAQLAKGLGWLPIKAP